jgi:hypothetical protein
MEVVLSLLAATAITLPTALVTSPAIAGCCNKGPGPNSSGAAKAAISAVEREIQQAKNKLEGTDASIAEAYTRAIQINDMADEKSVAGLSVVKEALGTLVQDIEMKAAERFLAAQAEYEEGNHDEALAVYAELAEFDGLAAARKAKTELKKEEDRVAWRGLLEESSGLINAHQLKQARKPLVELDRLARRTGYLAETEKALDAMQAVVLEQLEVAEEQIESGQYELAYASLRAISQLTPIRIAAVKARGVLKESMLLEGMKQAEISYEEARKAKRQREGESTGTEADSRREIEVAAIIRNR